MGAIISQHGMVSADNKVPMDIVTATRAPFPPMRAAKTCADEAVGKALNSNSLWRSTRESPSAEQDRKSVGEGTSVSVGVDIGGSRIIQKKHTTEKSENKRYGTEAK